MGPKLKLAEMAFRGSNSVQKAAGFNNEQRAVGAFTPEHWETEMHCVDLKMFLSNASSFPVPISCVTSEIQQSLKYSN